MKYMSLQSALIVSDGRCGAGYVGSVDAVAVDFWRRSIPTSPISRAVRSKRRWVDIRRIVHRNEAIGQAGFVRAITWASSERESRPQSASERSRETRDVDEPAARADSAERLRREDTRGGRVAVSRAVTSVGEGSIASAPYRSSRCSDPRDRELCGDRGRSSVAAWIVAS